MANVINQNHIDKSLSYSEYMAQITELINQGKTSGPDQSPEMVEYSKMNLHRINRLEKHTMLYDDLVNAYKNIEKKYYWVVLSEAWCGDAAQILPVVNKIAEINPNITLRILFRDENPEVINDNLTNGTKSIPKLIILDSELNKLGTWGPRPKALLKLVDEIKQRPNYSKDEMIIEIQKWYNNDNTQEIQKDFIEIAKSL